MTTYSAYSNIASAYTYQVETLALFERMVVQLSDSLKTLINNFMIALKTGGYYAKFEWFYLLGLHTEQASLLDWCAGHYDITNYGATWTIKYGITGDGSSQYMTSPWRENSNSRGVYDSQGAGGCCLGAYVLGSTGTGAKTIMGVKHTFSNYNKIGTFSNSFIYWNHYTNSTAGDDGTSMTFPRINHGYSPNTRNWYSERYNGTTFKNALREGTTIQGKYDYLWHFLCVNVTDTSRAEYSLAPFGCFYAGSYMTNIEARSLFTLIKQFYTDYAAL